MGSFHKIDQPRLALKDLLKRLRRGSCRRDLGEDFRRFIEGRDLAVGIDGDHTIVKIGEDLLPRYLRCRSLLRWGRCLHNQERNCCEIIADSDGRAMARGAAGLALTTLPMVLILYTLRV